MGELVLFHGQIGPDEFGSVWFRAGGICLLGVHCMVETLDLAVCL